MNMNFTTWGHLMMSILPRYSAFATLGSSLSTAPDAPDKTGPPSTAALPKSDTIRAAEPRSQADEARRRCRVSLCREAPVITLSISVDHSSPAEHGRRCPTTVPAERHAPPVAPPQQQHVVNASIDCSVATR